MKASLQISKAPVPKSAHKGLPLSDSCAMFYLLIYLLWIPLLNYKLLKTFQKYLSSPLSPCLSTDPLHLTFDLLQPQKHLTPAPSELTGSATVVPTRMREISLHHQLCSTDCFLGLRVSALFDAPTFMLLQTLFKNSFSYVVKGREYERQRASSWSQIHVQILQ